MSTFFIIGVFIVVWALVLGPMIANNGTLAIQAGNLTGIEAFMASGQFWNLVILICILIAIIATGYYGGSG
jgi:hypothetical protein